MKGGEKMHPKLLLITPYAMAEHLSEVLEKVHRLGKIGNTIRKKRVIAHGELLKKHFNYLPKADLEKVVSEWVDQEIYALVIAECPPNTQEELMFLVYISPDDERAKRDLRLWFPELFIDSPTEPATV